jgi:serine protease Do
MSGSRTVVLALATGAATGGLAAAGTLSPQLSRPGPAFVPEFVAQPTAGLPSFSDVVDAVKPSVIGVRTISANRSGPRHSGSPTATQLPPFAGPQEAPDSPEGHQLPMTQGSGFFISADGYAVTNGHVAEDSDTVEIVTDDAQTYTAKVVGIDPVSDLALLKVDGGKDFAPLELADRAPRVGEWVLAIGNPFGLGGTVTAGIVSARNRNIGANAYEDLIQIDAPVNQGNSGGPTFDLEGKVIGINTLIVSPTGGSIGIGFAIPADTLKAVIPQLKENGFVTRGWIGVQFQPSPDVTEGGGREHGEQAHRATVAQVQPNGPAAAAGIASGDVIVSVDGAPIEDARNLAKKIREMKPGASAKLGVIRDGREKIIAVSLGELPVKTQGRAIKKGEEQRVPSARASGLGLRLAPDSGGSGVVVIAIDPNGGAAGRGLGAGDVIIEVGGQAVSMPAEVQAALRKARDEGRRSVLVRLRSGETTRFVAVPSDPT